MKETKGKNFSCNNSTGNRRKGDDYATAYSLTRLLLDQEDLDGPILEPACGRGAIVKVLLERRYSIINITSYDLYHGKIKKDFLQETDKYRTIITNPPYSLAYEFIQKAKTLAPNIYFLLPLSYLHGKERYDNIYSDNNYPLKHIYIFTRYPMLGDKLRKDGMHRTGMMVYAWFHFAKHYKGKPTISWLDNDEYVIRKRTKAD